MLVSGGMDNNIIIWDLSFLMSLEKKYKERHKPIILTIPKYISKYFHKNYVDSACFLGDWILSKSITNCISLWKPSYNNLSRPPKKICNFFYKDGELWFMRFGINYRKKFLAIGTTKGEIYLWSLKNKLKNILLQNYNCCTTIRRVSFNQNGTNLIAICDDGIFANWIEK